jgi:3-hydroxyisobutyrate dehydrogenase-like beta-hydroxyacid dehydrogenase
LVNKFSFVYFQNRSVYSFLDAAKEVQASTPLTEKATELYREICSKGLNKKDFSVIFKYLNEQ